MWMGSSTVVSLSFTSVEGTRFQIPLSLFCTDDDTKKERSVLGVLITSAIPKSTFCGASTKSMASAVLDMRNSLSHKINSMIIPRAYSLMFP